MLRPCRHRELNFSIFLPELVSLLSLSLSVAVAQTIYYVSVCLSVCMPVCERCAFVQYMFSISSLVAEGDNERMVQVHTAHIRDPIAEMAHSSVFLPPLVGSNEVEKRLQ